MKNAQYCMKLKGAARIRLIDQRVIDECRIAHPDWPIEELRLLALHRIENDTGWSNNTITDGLRRRVANGNGINSSFRIFIHASTNPSSVVVDSLQNTYTNQTPSQVRSPDSFVANASTLVQTRTVQFPAPTVARNINIVGLTGSTAVSSNTIFAIHAMTKLSSTIQQATNQVADAQYRITFSFDTE